MNTVPTNCHHIGIFGIENIDILSIKKAIDTETVTGRLMAQIVISANRKGDLMNLYDLIRLDSENFTLAVQVMAYRRSLGWGDDEFMKLERYALHRLSLEPKDVHQVVNLSTVDSDVGDRPFQV